MHRKIRDFCKCINICSRIKQYLMFVSYEYTSIFAKDTNAFFSEKICHNHRNVIDIGNLMQIFIEKLHKTRKMSIIIAFVLRKRIPIFFNFKFNSLKIRMPNKYLVRYVWITKNIFVIYLTFVSLITLVLTSLRKSRGRKLIYPLSYEANKNTRITFIIDKSVS